MKEESRSSEEIRRLADKMFDLHIDAASLERLDQLISNDLSSLQTYVERISFHGDLMKQSTERSAVRQAEMAMGRILHVKSSREKRQTWIFRIATAVCCVLLGIFIERMAQFRFALPAKIGTVASMTSDLQKSGGALELGHVVRAGSQFELQEGILSLQLPGVSVNLIGPVTARMVDHKTLDLIRGSMHATVQKEGEGFTVKTPGSTIVDLGTEFSVEYQPETGTAVNVLRGRVQASLLDRAGAAIKMFDVTSRRAALLDERSSRAHEVNFSATKFEEVIRAKGTIRSIDGSLRTLTRPPESLKAEAQITTNHMLVIPEQQNVLLTEDVHFQSLHGPVHLKAGTRLASYLVHYDPDEWTTFAPRGAVTFDGRIAAVLVEGQQLNRTDAMFGLPDTVYEQGKFRELELGEDEIQISDDRQTISFYFGVSGQKAIDQARVLVVRDE